MQAPLLMFFSFLSFLNLYQRYMVAAIQDLAEEPNQESAALVASFLEACNIVWQHQEIQTEKVSCMAG